MYMTILLVVLFTATTIDCKTRFGCTDECFAVFQEQCQQLTKTQGGYMKCVFNYSKCNEEQKKGCRLRYVRMVLKTLQKNIDKIF